MSSGQEQSKVMTVGEFIEAVLVQANISEARTWLDHYIEKNDDPKCKAPRPKWAIYCQMPLNFDSLQDIAYIFQAEIVFSMRWQSRQAEHIRAQGRMLLQAIYEKSREIVPDIQEQDMIWLPSVEVAYSGRTRTSK